MSKRIKRLRKAVKKYGFEQDNHEFIFISKNEVERREKNNESIPYREVIGIVIWPDKEYLKKEENFIGISIMKDS